VAGARSEGGRLKDSLGEYGDRILGRKDRLFGGEWSWMSSGGFPSSIDMVISVTDICLCVPYVNDV